ncbi:translation elongation factor Ts (EF-Ts) [Desulfatibacillum alkenivorans DSM 16219]|jgi:elongation factor Ts|uniref:Elongation factor Ts n=1 Tax=Desulfatibacillum alkenivorans DSM 16219 TaxID=1121393 RepID=A0A1M6DXZ0_9BACT|nr:translation elongation factor Ts [Desulfatibacillum alkenivorans]SHI77990.1 translation elongation factor Ts (EF-Ts) [Desulfatibacillum alkenivorans DSM 16219]
MATITAEMVKNLRAATGAGMMDCKKALAESDGDMDKALDYLRKKGIATAQKRAGRETKNGVVMSYIHMDKIGVLLEVNCETDFVAKNDDFVEFARNVAMHICATNPLAVTEEDVPAEIVEKEREIYMGQVLEMGKPENIAGKIVDGKIAKFLKDNCLVNQPFVKNPDITIGDLLTETIGKTGENISIRRFSRFVLGEE